MDGRGKPKSMKLIMFHTDNYHESVSRSFISLALVAAMLYLTFPKSKLYDRKV